MSENTIFLRHKVSIYTYLIPYTIGRTSLQLQSLSPLLVIEITTEVKLTESNH